jgi:hypothetical protein
MSSNCSIEVTGNVQTRGKRSAIEFLRELAIVFTKKMAALGAGIGQVGGIIGSCQQERSFINSGEK